MSVLTATLMAKRQQCEKNCYKQVGSPPSSTNHFMLPARLAMCPCCTKSHCAAEEDALTTGGGKHHLPACYTYGELTALQGRMRCLFLVREVCQWGSQDAYWRQSCSALFDKSLPRW
eukprot:s6143_g3.t1